MISEFLVLLLALGLFNAENSKASQSRVEKCSFLNEYCTKDVDCCGSYICRTDKKICIDGKAVLRSNFKQSCSDGHCTCKGFPQIHIKERLLKGRVNLHDCLRACDKRKLCFGVEFWPNDLSNGEVDHANCFECPTIPGKIQTIEIITGGAWSIPNKATVYEKTTTNLSHKGEMCSQKGMYCGMDWRCCKHLNCNSGKCQPRKECFPTAKDGRMSCPRGWYCDGLLGACRKCNPRYYKEPQKCKNNYLGGACNAQDHEIRKDEKRVEREMKKCVGTFGTCVGTCAANCIQRSMGFSMGCAKCMGEATACGKSKCWGSCIFSPSSPKCRRCVENYCRPSLIKCTGFSSISPEAFAEIVGQMSPQPTNKGAACNAKDHEIRKDEKRVEREMKKCVGTFGTCVGTCAANCIQKSMGFSMGCAQCMGEATACGKSNCWGSCIFSSSSSKCRRCIENYCTPSLNKCAGFSSLSPEAFAEIVGQMSQQQTNNGR